MKKLIDVFRTVAVLGLVPMMTVQPSGAWGGDGRHMINRLAEQIYTAWVKSADPLPQRH